MYQFSAPMPYNIDDINQLIEINNYIEKSKITSLFFSLPSDCELFTGFEQYRNLIFGRNWNYWKGLISKCLDKETDFIYLLNSPNRLPIESFDFEKKLEKLDKLLDELSKLGVNKLRIADHKLMSYIEKNYPNFIIYASTSLEYKIISEYRNFMKVHPNTKQIVPSHDCIKNFTLLKNLKKLFPNVEIELMVNEGCIRGCPLRANHAGEIIDRNIIYKNDINLSNKYYTQAFCDKVPPINSITSANVIYPWEIKEYSKIGINKFKLVGRDIFDTGMERCLHRYYAYLKGIDYLKNINNMPVGMFIHHSCVIPELQYITLKDYKKYLPKISYFKKYGNLCSSRCGVECRYCDNCAKKIEKVLMKKHEEMRKRTVPVCVIT